ncbi:hypothetical protein GCM10010510_18260 [Streptomyces anandii JCM 4720]|nr:hypothetical protein GCM10010510_18260 [Streptomyces anandii JCM 4720]
MEEIRVTGQRTGRWPTGGAGWCLAASVALHVLAVVTHPTRPLDLRVYHEAAGHLLTGGLYDYALRTGPPIPSLPFTYPPFAALVFLAPSRLPWAVTVVLWQALSVASLLVVAGCAVRLLGPLPDGRARNLALLWTAVGLWLEPVRHTLDQGQVNLLLGAVVMAGLALPARPVARGAAVGLAAAVKLTPAVAGLYLLATRQWRAAAWAAVTGAAATALAWCVAPGESARYWSGLVTDTRRMGPDWSVRNQSLRGALDRLLGTGQTATVAWVVACVLVTALAAYGLWVTARRGDRLGALVVAELYGLLVCPISWSHHWIWCVPAMIRLLHGPHGRRALGLLALTAWASAAGARLVPQLIRAEDHLVRAPEAYPALLAWPGCVYAVCALLTLWALCHGGGGAGPGGAVGAGDAEDAEGGAGRRGGRAPASVADAAGRARAVVSSRRAAAPRAAGRPARRAPGPWPWTAAPGPRCGCRWAGP